MGLLSRFKLQKLKIRIYSDRARSSFPKTFTVMFNPESLSTSHENVFEDGEGINSSSSEARYSLSRAEVVRLKLIMDGTGVDKFGLEKIFSPTVSVTEQVQDFLKACVEMDGKIHQPKFLRIQWGDGELMQFDCRLKSVNINYVSFDRSGAPLRAELDASFVEDVARKKRLSKVGKSSPDLSHSRIVRSGDTLPLLCKEIYGSSEHYLRVARVNQLDHFRDLEPGMEIVFPPIVKGGIKR